MTVKQIIANNQIDVRLEHMAISDDISAFRIYLTKDNGSIAKSEVHYGMVNNQDLNAFIKSLSKKFITSIASFIAYRHVDRWGPRILEDGKIIPLEDSKHVNEFGYDVMKWIERELISLDDIYFQTYIPQLYDLVPSQRDREYFNRNFESASKNVQIHIWEPSQTKAMLPTSSGDFCVKDVKVFAEELKKIAPSARMYYHRTREYIALSDIALLGDFIEIHSSFKSKCAFFEFEVDIKTYNEYFKAIGLEKTSDQPKSKLKTKSKSNNGEYSVKEKIKLIDWLVERDYFGIKDLI